jgi:hypothetical protein
VSEKALLSQFQLYVDVFARLGHFGLVYKDKTFDDECHILASDPEIDDL